MMIIIESGRWRHKFGKVFIHERIYLKGYKWTPFCIIKKRYVKIGNTLKFYKDTDYFTQEFNSINFDEFILELSLLNTKRVKDMQVYRYILDDYITIGWTCKVSQKYLSHYRKQIRRAYNEGNSKE